MEVLSYSHAYVGGGHQAGAETTLHDVMRLLHDDPHSTTALLSKPHKDGSGPYSIDGVRVQPFTSKLDPELWFPRSDVILTHLECALRSGLVASKYGVPVGHLIHNDQSYCITAAERGADFLVYNTDWVKKKYDHIGLPGVVLHPIVDPQRYSVESSRKYITIINLSDGTENGLSYDKGPHTFYELARRNPNLEFLGVKGAYGYQLVEDLPNVTIWEHQRNILEVFRQTAVLLVPSKYESYGRGPVEAACSGIPSIVSNTEGLREALGTDTYYCEFNDFDSWDSALHSTLANYSSFSRGSYRRADINYSRSNREWKDFTELIEKVGSNGSYYSRRFGGSPRVLTS